MITEGQVKALIMGLKQDIKDAKDRYKDGSLGEEQYFAILHYQNAQIKALEWVLGNGM